MSVPWTCPLPSSGNRMDSIRSALHFAGGLLPTRLQVLGVQSFECGGGVATALGPQAITRAAGAGACLNGCVAQDIQVRLLLRLVFVLNGWYNNAWIITPLFCCSTALRDGIQSARKREISRNEAHISTNIKNWPAKPIAHI